MVAIGIVQVMVMVSDREEMGHSLHLCEYVTLCVSMCVWVNAEDWHEASSTHFLSTLPSKECCQLKWTCTVISPSERIPTWIHRQIKTSSERGRAIEQIPHFLLYVNGLEWEIKTAFWNRAWGKERLSHAELFLEQQLQVKFTSKQMFKVIIFEW